MTHGRPQVVATRFFDIVRLWTYRDSGFYSLLTDLPWFNGLSLWKGSPGKSCREHEDTFCFLYQRKGWNPIPGFTSHTYDLLVLWPSTHHLVTVYASFLICIRRMLKYAHLRGLWELKGMLHATCCSRCWTQGKWFISSPLSHEWLVNTYLHRGWGTCQVTQLQFKRSMA